MQLGTPGGRKPRRRTGTDLDELSHPLLGDEPTLQLLPDRSEVAGALLQSSWLQMPHQRMSSVLVYMPNQWQCGTTLVRLHCFASPSQLHEQGLRSLSHHTACSL